MYIVIFLTALIAGLVQGIAGFGSGPIQMMSYPFFLSLPNAAALSVAVSVFLNLDMMLKYKKYISLKKVLIPEILYMIVCTIAIYYSSNINQVIMKKIFGIFLICLSIYYLYFNNKKRRHLSLLTTIIYIIISALCDAFFGIGGPLMVIYFLNVTSSNNEYLGSVTTFFLVNGIYNSLFRVYRGLLTLTPALIIGIVSILIGVTIAHKITGKLNEKYLTKFTYIMIGITGLINLFI